MQKGKPIVVNGIKYSSISEACRELNLCESTIRHKLSAGKTSDEVFNSAIFGKGVKNLMNRTCKGCYAADTGCHPGQGVPKGCTLKYKTDGHGKPLEECPKPKSWKQLIKLQK